MKRPHTTLALATLCAALTGCLSESEATCDLSSEPNTHACREAAAALFRDAGPGPDVPGFDAGIRVERCADLFAASATGVIAIGQISGDDVSLDCNGNHEEYVVQWLAPAAGSWVVETSGSLDTTLGVFEGGCAIGARVGCNDDGGDGTNSRVMFEADAGQSLLFLVQGFSGRTGSFSLSVHR